MKGATAFHWPGNQAVEQINIEILNRFPKALQRRTITSHAVVEGFWSPDARALIRRHVKPCSLIETGFGSHPGDRAEMLKPTTKTIIARAIVDSLPVYLMRRSQR
jgi:N-acetylmuramoyl-L-alanine amidase